MSSNALAKTFAAKQIHKDAETRFHSLDKDVLEETDEEKCFRADFAINTPKDTNTAVHIPGQFLTDFGQILDSTSHDQS